MSSSAEEKIELKMSSVAEEKIELKSSDGETFMVDKNVAMQSAIIKNMIDDGCGGSPITIKNVPAVTLVKVIEYCKRHVTTPDEYNIIGKAEMEKFDNEFVEVLKDDQDTLFDLILAANYMDIKGLLDLLCKTVADMMKGKKAADIRKLFNIKNDYTPEQEEKIRQENPWAFE